ncbi:MAG: TraR/DksA family transcriptional regulator [Planctomycetota bacterium]|nr:MAG: TraR/DksA family transcriptional regulator [Planctomycetota bacterium]
MLKANELDLFRSQLMLLQARIQGDVDHLSDGALDTGGDSKSPTHMAELGTETYEQEFSLRMMENEQDVLDEIRAALHRIDEGIYGVCQSCVDDGRPPSKCSIPKVRLKYIPYARNCVDCERKKEGHFVR